MLQHPKKFRFRGTSSQDNCAHLNALWLAYLQISQATLLCLSVRNKGKYSDELAPILLGLTDVFLLLGNIDIYSAMILVLGEYVSTKLVLAHSYVQQKNQTEDLCFQVWCGRMNLSKLCFVIISSRKDSWLPFCFLITEKNNLMTKFNKLGPILMQLECQCSNLVGCDCCIAV